MADANNRAPAGTDLIQLRRLPAWVAARHDIPRRLAAILLWQHQRRAAKLGLPRYWWLALAEAQFLTHIGPYPRVRLGEERHLTSPDEICPDCACGRGEYHAFGCAHEECSHCGGHAAWCGCAVSPDDGEA
jgi:hypothetical protein